MQITRRVARRSWIAAVLAVATASVPAFVPVAAALPALAGASQVTVSDTLPSALTDAAAPTGFDVTLQNDGDDESGVRADFTITPGSGTTLAPSNLTLDYDTGGGTFAAIPLSVGPNGTLTGYFGPQAGFPMPNGYDATTAFTVAADGIPTQSLTVGISIDQVDGTGTVTNAGLATTSASASVSAQTISLSGLPTSLAPAAQPASFTGTITNPDSQPVAGNAVVDFSIDTTNDPDLTANQVILTYTSGDTSGQIPLGGGGGTPITGQFGPPTGFPLAAGYDVTTPFTVTLAPGAPSGSVTVTADLDELSPAQTLATTGPDTVAIPVSALTLATALPATIEELTPPTTFTATSDNAGTADLNGVRFDFTITPPSGTLAPGNVDLEYLDDGAYTAIPLTASTGGTLTGYFGPPGGFTDAAGAMMTTDLEVAVNGVPAGNLTVAISADRVDTSGTITQAGLATASGTVAVTQPAPLTIDTTGLPYAVVGQPYSTTLAASGGIAPYTWKVSSGSLPAGLALNPTTGAITGTPTTAATSSFQITVTDSAYKTAEAATAPETLLVKAHTNLGYRLYASDGGVFNFGDAGYYGSEGGKPLNAPVVGSAPTPDGGGYWLVASDGGVFAFGDATFHGSTGNLHLAKPVVGMAPAPGGEGYWLVASDGGIFSYGTAPFHGSAGNLALAKPIVGMAATPDGGGYWLVASDGGLFSYGDAHFYGSEGGAPLDQPVVGITATPDGDGYALVAADGGMFTFGDFTFYGSTGNLILARPIVSVSS